MASQAVEIDEADLQRLLEEMRRRQRPLTLDDMVALLRQR
jgi:hypothetical protein